MITWFLNRLCSRIDNSNYCFNTYQLVVVINHEFWKKQQHESSSQISRARSLKLNREGTAGTLSEHLTPATPHETWGFHYSYLLLPSGWQLLLVFIAIVAVFARTSWRVGVPCAFIAAVSLIGATIAITLQGKHRCLLMRFVWCHKERQVSEIRKCRVPASWDPQKNRPNLLRVPNLQMSAGPSVLRLL